MEEITRFIILAQSDRYTLTELCEQFGRNKGGGGINPNAEVAE